MSSFFTFSIFILPAHGTVPNLSFNTIHKSVESTFPPNDLTIVLPTGFASKLVGFVHSMPPPKSSLFNTMQSLKPNYVLTPL